MDRQGKKEKEKDNRLGRLHPGGNFEYSALGFLTQREGKKEKKKKKKKEQKNRKQYEFP